MKIWLALFTATIIYSTQKSRRNSQQLHRNRIARSWQKIQGSNCQKTEKSSSCPADKKKTSEEKVKKKVFKKKKLIDLPCESNMKTVVEEYVSSEHVYSAGR